MRQSTWKTFPEAPWDVLASVDFTTIEVWTKSGLGNRLIEPGEEAGRTTGEVARRKRLGGILWYYYGEAA